MCIPNVRNVFPTIELIYFLFPLGMGLRGPGTLKWARGLCVAFFDDGFGPLDMYCGLRAFRDGSLVPAPRETNATDGRCVFCNEPAGFVSLETNSKSLRLLRRTLMTCVPVAVSALLLSTTHGLRAIAINGVSMCRELRLTGSVLPKRN